MPRGVAVDFKRRMGGRQPFYIGKSPSKVNGDTSLARDWEQGGNAKSQHGGGSLGLELRDVKSSG